ELSILFDLTADIKTLRKDLADGSPQVISDILRTAEGLKTAIEQRAALIQSAKDALEKAQKAVTDAEGKFVKNLTDRLGDAGKDLARQVLEDFKASAVGQDYEQIVETVRKAVEILRKVKAVVDVIFNEPPVLSKTRVPEAIEIPADRAPNTQLELQRTSRIIG